MSSSFDSVFGIHADALKLREARGRILASNLANADTPNYKAQDLDFRAAMLKQRGDEMSLRSPSMKLTNSRHIAGFDGDSVSTADYLRFRNPTQPSLDGNTVETHIEKAKFMENAMQHSMTLRFLDDRIKGIKDALRSQ
ncbi:MAG: flagellar basal body rod protein FlgB [Gammaproteobacteria bacterium]|nr:flagellar basal body rod protein FlgB [Gammaproteobacteria bacterium]